MLEYASDGPLGPSDDFKYVLKTLKARLSEPRARLHLRRSQIACYGSERASSAYLIEDGCVIVGNLNEAGEEIAVEIAGPGEICGLGQALLNRPFGYCIRAASTTTLWRVTAADLRTQMEDHHFSEAVYALLANHSCGGSERIEALLEASLPAKLRALLRWLAGPTAPSLRIPISQGDLAALLGASRQRVNEALRSLAGDGAVELQRNAISIVNVGAL